MPAFAPVAAAFAVLAGPPWTPPLSPAPADDTARSRAPGTPTTLYVNFDGAVLQTGCGNDPVGNCSTLAGTFDGYVGPFDGNEIQKMSILQAVRTRLAPYGVFATTERPSADVEYSMVLYGDLGEQSFAGVAPYIDCEDLHPRDTSFSQGFSTSNTGSTVVLQEAAHTWGLEHVDGEGDVMNPFVVSGNTQVFEDACHPIVANTDLDPAPGTCNVMHTRFCPAGSQNSHRELLYLFGPSTPDTTPPRVTVVHPADGAVLPYPAGTFPLVVAVDDDRHPQFYSVSLYQGDTMLLSQEAGHLDRAFTVAQLTDPPEGTYELRVEVADEAGNVAAATVSFSVASGADTDTEGASDAADLPDAAFDEGGCRTAAPAGGPHRGLALPALLALFPRRKRR